MQVAQLVGYVSETSAYHHGEASLMATIINLAQDYVGSNNMNLLLPNGQFGTRDQGGKDHAAARYIYTELAPVIRTVMHPADDAVLSYQQDDGRAVEPEWYMPVIPLVLVNGAEGIGTGTLSNSSRVVSVADVILQVGVLPSLASTPKTSSRTFAVS